MRCHLGGMIFHHVNSFCRAALPRQNFSFIKWKSAIHLIKSYLPLARRPTRVIFLIYIYIKSPLIQLKQFQHCISFIISPGKNCTVKFLTTFFKIRNQKFKMIHVTLHLYVQLSLVNKIVRNFLHFLRKQTAFLWYWPIRFFCRPHTFLNGHVFSPEEQVLQKMARKLWKLLLLLIWKLLK